MKGRLAVFLTVAVMVFVLVALNAASYVRVEQSADTEDEPDRSTFNSGATGTRAFFEYLRQTGADAARWRLPLSELSSGREAGGPPGSTFVVVGALRKEFTRDESQALLRWVARGGRLVVVDRSPDAQLLPTSGRWRVGSELFEIPGRGTRADDAEEMTRGVELVRPAQPTALTRDVAGVSRSRFAGRLHVYQVETVGDYDAEAPPAAVAPARATEEDEGFGGEGGADEPPPPAPKPEPGAVPPPVAIKIDSPVPISHLDDGRAGYGSMLVDYAYGSGRVVVMSDPYVLSNAGINRADNLFLAVNLVTGGRARTRVLFDEFHQGYGGGRNETLAYFRGTPVVWLFAQAALVALALVWTRGRRFARALPAPRVDRRSKLEFVASMAELQQRARAYDLALENVYARTRRALARYGGLPPTAPPERVAERVAARSGGDKAALEALLRECEDACAGAPLTARRALELARRLRELERDLGLLMRSREIRQTR
ncbi:MAG TPA: DUF4350 domain-containing protein [Pyrinomonadaceae bacterium]|jgi:hypothetical protein|nr:DUF4350 domain-containing protein [Pyrinomonadaceae bacterium]